MPNLRRFIGIILALGLVNNGLYGCSGGTFFDRSSGHEGESHIQATVEISADEAANLSAADFDLLAGLEVQYAGEQIRLLSDYHGWFVRTRRDETCQINPGYEPVIPVVDVLKALRAKPCKPTETSAIERGEALTSDHPGIGGGEGSSSGSSTEGSAGAGTGGRSASEEATNKLLERVDNYRKSNSSLTFGNGNDDSTGPGNGNTVGPGNDDGNGGPSARDTIKGKRQSESFGGINDLRDRVENKRTETKEKANKVQGRSNASLDSFYKSVENASKDHNASAGRIKATLTNLGGEKPAPQTPPPPDDRDPPRDDEANPDDNSNVYKLKTRPGTIAGEKIRGLVRYSKFARERVEQDGGANQQQREQILDLSDVAILMADESFTEGDVEAAEQFTQTALLGISIVLDFVPGVSFAKDTYAILAGKDVVTGESVSDVERGVLVASLFLPSLLSGTAKGIGKVAKGISRIADKGGKLGHVADSIKQVLNKADDALKSVTGKPPCVTSNQTPFWNQQRSLFDLLMGTQVAFAADCANLGENLADLTDDLIGSGVDPKDVGKVVDSAGKIGLNQPSQIKQLGTTLSKSNIDPSKVASTLDSIGQSSAMSRAVKNTPAGKPMFYVKATGEAVPSTGYKWPDEKRVPRFSNLSTRFGLDFPRPA